MKKNIEILKEMREKAFRFDILADELIEIKEVEDYAPEDLVVNEHDKTVELLYEADEILNTLKDLSYGGKVIMNVEEFDIDGLEYIIGCIKHRITDLCNYLDMLQDSIMQARMNAENLIGVYDILCEPAFEEENNRCGGNT